jgi:hypothetical protein
MPWVTPKTDWAEDDAIGTTDLNRIGSDTVFLRDLFGTSLLKEFGADIRIPTVGEPTTETITPTNQWHHIYETTKPAVHVYGTIKYIKNYYGLKAGHRVGFIQKVGTTATTQFRPGTTLPGASPLHCTIDLDGNEVIVFIYTGSYWVTEQKN